MFLGGDIMGFKDYAYERPDMTKIEADFNIVDRYNVTHGSASLQVLLVG